MIGHMAIAIALPGFYDFGRSMTPFFLLDGSFSLPFSKFIEKLLEIYGLKI